MKKEEINKVVRKMDIVIDWFDDIVGGEFKPSIERVAELIVRLEEVEKNEEE